MYVVYTILLMLGGLILLPHILWRGVRGATYHHDLAERLGYGIVTPESVQAVRGCLWFHAASVGEVQGLQPIIAQLHARQPARPIVLSTFTPAGKRIAQRLVPEALAIFVLPLDLPWLMRRLCRGLQPHMVIIQETELWPNFLRAAARQHVPVVLVNGRLSPRSFRHYRWLRPFMQRVLANVTLFLVQSEDIAQRFCHLGADEQRVQVTGNTNIDRALLRADQPPPTHALAPLARERRLLVAGSTHEGEETVLLTVYQRLLAQTPDLILVLAPRHLERTEAVARQIQARGYHVLRRSQWQPEAAEVLPHATVLLLDTMGELATLYSLCTIAFVGGSLVPIGGHNVLEPAVFAKPILFGPHMFHFPELAALLLHAGGAMQVDGEAALHARLFHLLAHPEDGRTMGQQALAVLAANRGALARTCQAVEACLNARPSITRQVE
jgi:3-deoxy-D-manno-octulosonic-acid transferase